MITMLLLLAVAMFIISSTVHLMRDTNLPLTAYKPCYSAANLDVSQTFHIRIILPLLNDDLMAINMAM
jgi:hypothetical protein